jgi:hypothetical protein
VGGPAISLEMLFRGRRRRSTSTATLAGTSFFSDQTQRKWQLVDHENRAASGEEVEGMLLRQSRRLRGFEPDGHMGRLAPAAGAQAQGPVEHHTCSPLGQPGGPASARPPLG